MPFVKGQSGNPAGRPVGSRNKFSQVMQGAFEQGGPILVQQLFELAGDGNPAAMRQCFDRLMGKHRPSAVELPSPESPTYIMDALTEIHRALGAGEIASDEASRLVDLVGRTARVLAAKAAAVIDFADRLERCEQALITLFNAARAAAAPETATSQVPQATAAPAIDNNNAKTMAPAAEAEAQAPTEAAAEAEARAPTAASEPAPIDNNNGITMEAAAALDEAVRTTLPPRADSVRDRLLADAA